MAISYTVTDNADGTGTAVISGSVGGSTNNLYRASWTGDAGALAWTLHGTRLGDGSIAIAVNGNFFWRLDNIDGATLTQGDGYYQPVAAAGSSISAIHKGILDAAVVRIKSLSLSGISDLLVMDEWIPRVWEVVDSTPCVIVAPPGAETMDGLWCNKDDIGYPIVVCFVDKLNQDCRKNMGRNLLWRERVSKAFRAQRLPGAPLVWKCAIEPDAIVDPTAYQNGYLASLMVIRATTRETRGI